MKKSSFYHTPLHLTPPLGVFPSEYRHPLWYGKTRMVSLPDGVKVSKISIRFGATHERDRRTDGHRMLTYTALMHMHRVVKMMIPKTKLCTKFEVVSFNGCRNK